MGGASALPHAAPADVLAADSLQLLADLDSGGDNQLSRAGLTGTQIDQIRASIGRDADASPKGWTWHHTENPGELILVPRGIHEAYQHTGGEALWGGGE